MDWSTIPEIRIWIRLLQSKKTETRAELILQRSIQARGGPLPQRMDQSEVQMDRRTAVQQRSAEPTSSGDPGAEAECRADKRKEARGMRAAARSGARAVAGMREGRRRRKRTGRNESGGRREFGTAMDDGKKKSIIILFVCLFKDKL